MTEPIADALILVFTFGVSLREWRDCGMLSREWTLYRALLPLYGRIILVTYGQSGEADVLDAVLTPEEKGRVTVISNSSVQPLSQYVMQIPALVATHLEGADTAVIKTNQMAGGDVAARIASSLRESGKKVGLIARGGYLWTRFVAHEHGPHSKHAVESARREHALCDAADAVVGTTPDMVEDLAWRYGLDPAITTVIPNYVLADKPPAAATDRDPGMLLYAGQLIPRKRVSILIEAMALLPEPFRGSIRLEVVGEGSQQEELEALAVKLGAPVTFHDRMPHEQLMDKMRRCAIYVQASELEGHPKTVLEAMSCGTPVVVADAPGLEVVQHGFTGLKLAPDARSFVHAILELLDDEDWRAALGSAAALAARESCGLESVLAKETQVHRAALERGSKRPTAGLKAG